MSNKTDEETNSGHCHCGRIQFTVTGKLRQVLVCHCEDCLRCAGNSWAASAAKPDHVTIKGDGLKWYQSSDIAERGFCSNCGAQMFYRQFKEDSISIAAGMFDRGTKLSCRGQVYGHTHPGYLPLGEKLKDLDDDYNISKKS